MFEAEGVAPSVSSAAKPAVFDSPLRFDERASSAGTSRVDQLHERAPGASTARVDCSPLGQTELHSGEQPERLATDHELYS